MWRWTKHKTLKGQKLKFVGVCVLFAFPSFLLHHPSSSAQLLLFLVVVAVVSEAKFLMIGRFCFLVPCWPGQLFVRGRRFPTTPNSRVSLVRCGSLEGKKKKKTLSYNNWNHKTQKRDRKHWDRGGRRGTNKAWIKTVWTRNYYLKSGRNV
eukprot:GHVT01005575.1.p1 GENE.GHVT01005575.1~~GHVT01005575.1.p1  ORF type:complete len:151 (-),score=13.29 GHVT01005575.1:1046-1498(-)